MPPMKEPGQQLVRIGAAQPGSRLIDWRLTPAQALLEVDRSLKELEQLVHRAGIAGVNALVLPEDTLGLLHWEVGKCAVEVTCVP